MTKTCQNQLLNMVLLSNVYLLLVQLEPGLDVGRAAWVQFCATAGVTSV